MPRWSTGAIRRRASPRLTTLLASLVSLSVACSAQPAAPSGPTPPASLPPDGPGPYGVGARTLEIERDGLSPLTLELWYPTALTDAPPGTYSAGFLEIAGGAQRDATLDTRGAPYPLAAFSHGFGGIRFQSAFLTEHLASHGWVVVAPDHARSTLVDLDPSATTEVATLRPRDIADAVDAAQAELGPQVEQDRYAMVGHSFGAWTSLVVGGGQLDPAALQAVCAAEDRAVCGFFADQPFDPDAVATFARPDPRVAASVALAPGGWYAFGADGEGLADVHHMLVLGGTLDTDMPYAEEAAPTWQRLGGPRALGSLVGAGHWLFTDLCLLMPLADCGGPAAGFMDGERARDLIRSRTLAWLRVQLGLRPEDEPWLSAEADLGWQQDG